MEFINTKTMNNSRGEARVINKLQELGFVVNKPEVKNQPVYDLTVHLKNSISRTAYIQVKTRGENNPNGYRIGSKKRVIEIDEWLNSENPENYFIVMADFYQSGSIHVMHGKTFMKEVMAFSKTIYQDPRKMVDKEKIQVLGPLSQNGQLMYTIKPRIIGRSSQII